jgi:hypothetical protein
MSPTLIESIDEWNCASDFPQRNAKNSATCPRQRDEIARPARLMLGGRRRQRKLPKEVRFMSDRMSLGSTVGSSPAVVGRVPATPIVDEVLIADARAALRPAEMVERKLLSLLRSVPMPVSMLAGAFRKR